VQLLRKGRWALLTALFVWSFGFTQERLQLCAACHGPDGNSVTPGTPSIAGQPKLFIENQLVFFREELRKSSQMLPVVRGMKDPEIIKLAEHFSKLPAKPVTSGPVNKIAFSNGEQLSKKHRCNICHLSDFSGQQQVPRLALQREEYLRAEMIAYRDNKRPGGDTIMAAALYGVKDDEIAALAHYLARWRPN
jgi:cytochrome c553